MCLIALCHGVSAEHRLVVAANRDERHARPTAAADWWPDEPILAGRDLVAGGGWLGVDVHGRVAAVTNHFAASPTPAPRSRGDLVTGFLRGRTPADAFGDELAESLDQFGSFNLLTFDGRTLRYTSNRAASRTLAPGVHALSNTDPDANWPKLARSRHGLMRWLQSGEPYERLFDLLREQAPPESSDYRQRSLFVVDPEFGTRCSTILLIRRDGSAVFVERRFDSSGMPTGETRRDFALRRLPDS
jgi:uncharacterized protein with NRDE domain